jgi:nicotinate-nucleotide--dimethylbenzimidazole phosphoribosyltransferase
MQNSLVSGGLAEGAADASRVALQRAIEERLLSQTKPPGSLGLLEEIAARMARVQITLSPSAEKARICVFAGSHGIARSGVSAFPPEVTIQMVANFLAGGAAVCVLARAAGASLHVINTGVEGVPDPSWRNNPSYFERSQRAGTRSFLEDKAMSSTECQSALKAGEEQVRLAVKDGIEILAIGEMGIGNTTSASALCAALLNIHPDIVTGPGTGIDSVGLARKRLIVREALQKHSTSNGPEPTARHWLECVGGYEIAAMTGTIIAAAENGLPVLVDGFIATAAALVAARLSPKSLEVCFFAHQSGEPGHAIVLSQLGVKPILSLGMRLGEASGAALALPIVRASTRLFCEMATFQSAGISGKAPQ